MAAVGFAIRTRRRRQELQLRQSDSEQKLTSAPEGLSGGGAAGGWRALRTLRMLCIVRCACLAPAGLRAVDSAYRAEGARALHAAPGPAVWDGHAAWRFSVQCRNTIYQLSGVSVPLCGPAVGHAHHLYPWEPCHVIPALAHPPAHRFPPLPGWIVSYDDIEILKHPDGFDML